MTRALGVVDIGSNTVRLAAYGVEQGGGYRVLTERRAVLRLGAVGRRLGDTAFYRTRDVLRRFGAVCAGYGVHEVIAVATGAVRQADDGDEFAARLQADTGIPVTILSGGDEAALGFLGAVNTLAVEDGLVADIGGGSTELTRFSGRRPGPALSLPVGAVNLTNELLLHDPPTADERDRLARHTAAALAPLEWLRDPPGLPLVGVGGTFRVLARVARRRADGRAPLHGTVVPASLPARLLDEIGERSAAERARVPGIPGHRADVIVAGLAVIAAIVRQAEADRIVVCGHGLRDGVFFRWLRGDDAILPDVLQASVANCVARFVATPDRAWRVQRLALDLFDALAPVHSMDGDARRLLSVGAALRDVGACIDFYERARHTFYVVRRAALLGVDAQEQLAAAAVAAFDDLDGHRQRWARAGGEPGSLESTGRLGLLAAAADALVDILPEPWTAPRVEATPAAITLVLEADEDPGECLGDLGPEFRRLFGRPLLLRGAAG